MHISAQSDAFQCLALCNHQLETPRYSISSHIMQSKAANLENRMFIENVDLET